VRFQMTGAATVKLRWTMDVFARDTLPSSIPVFILQHIEWKSYIRNRLVPK